MNLFLVHWMFSFYRQPRGPDIKWECRLNGLKWRLVGIPQVPEQSFIKVSSHCVFSFQKYFMRLNLDMFQFSLSFCLYLKIPQKSQ